MQATVAKINQQETVFKHIQSYLRNLSASAPNTSKAYEGDIRQFFKYMRNKDIEDLTEQDLNFKNSDMRDYQSYFFHDFIQPNGKKYSNTTINRKINSVISLYRHLKQNDYGVDPDKLKIKELVNESKQIGFLTVEEIDHLIMLSDSEELKVFMMLALRTSMRKNALLNLKWEHIEKSYDEPDTYIIWTIDKGKKDYKEISELMYNTLLNIKTNNEYVFTMPASTLDYRFKTLCKKARIDERRVISVHSLRKTGVDFVKKYTGDLQAAQEQATHSSPAVTAKIYTTKPKNLAGKILDTKIDDNIFEQLTHKECVKLLESFGNGVGYALRSAAQKIVDAR